jgi:hypothetical protein
MCEWLLKVEYDVYHKMLCCSILLGLWGVNGIVVIFGSWYWCLLIIMMLMVVDNYDDDVDVCW